MLFSFLSRYRIKLGVIDDSDCACYVVFDNEAKQVLEESCVEILDPLLLVRSNQYLFLKALVKIFLLVLFILFIINILCNTLQKGDLSDTPTLLLNLIDKTFLFIVELQISDNPHFSPSYKVKKMTDNVDLINKFKEAHPIQIVSIIISVFSIKN